MDHNTPYGNFTFFPWNAYEMLGHADSFQHELETPVANCTFSAGCKLNP
jgi:hypothetical protein